jgi:hypothetical protein
MPFVYEFYPNLPPPAGNPPSFKIQIKIWRSHLVPRPDPLFSPPPVTLLTVAHARFSDSLALTPRFS